jgi:tRNA pseudouridine55 synthase
MFGLLNVDKPGGVTSRDVVNRVQRLVRPVKAGHAGTLDPLARGVLVIALGPATRLVEYVQRMPKRYEAVFLLGRRSDTLDIEGEVLELPRAPRPALSEVLAALPAFVGKIEQTPPAFSAVKVRGRRAYDLARQGKPVVLAPRRVEVYEIKLLAYEHPRLELEIACGAGTYVRSLGADLAASLGTAAVMSALARTAIGPFRVREAVPAEQLSREIIGQRLAPARRAAEQLPQIRLTTAEAARIASGRPIKNRFGPAVGEMAALNAAGDLAAILVADQSNWLRPAKNFPPARPGVASQQPPAEPMA